MTDDELTDLAADLVLDEGYSVPAAVLAVLALDEADAELDREDR